MRNIKPLLIYLALFAVSIVLYRAIDWLFAIFKQSSIFHGVMVFVGIASLPLWVLVSTSKDQRPFPPDAHFPRLLSKLVLFSVSTVVTLYGLSFWIPVLRTVAMAVFGVLAIAALVLIVLLLRADKNQAAQIP